MDKLLVAGSAELKGEVRISGAKNSCLPILAAVLLTEEPCKINNVPALKDVGTMIDILESLGKKTVFSGNTIEIAAGTVSGITASYDLVKTMRASIAVLGPLLARYRKARVSFPGGCIIGPRPVDLHLKGLKALGADIKIEEGYIVASAEKLRGTRIYLGGHFGSSVLATANTMMAAVLADGETVIEDAACEPEIRDLADLLEKMGALIKGAGTPTIRIRGVELLKGAEHDVIPDRIETGTYMIAAVMTGGNIEITGADLGHNMALVDKLKEAGGDIRETSRGFVVSRGKKTLNPVDITTFKYPGFPTDLQAQMMSLVTMSEGISVVTEKVYPERFIHISELNRMGADILLEGSTAIIKGVKRLSGAPVMASDLRASAALVLAGLVAEGETEISRIYHLDRGYEKIEEKMSGLGARISRVKE